ncbi:hypothetical protein ANCCEY_05789 [Ancylostoma ceylanicum]|uniref:Uncharacterized protein n=1 Tax=Ancylostoma ceylanicum TaxID=53326 RepID=A0A0D6LSS5_9BILA|nr:hypothetical protein ANCCEY_05789 [Ancylostoma ceylanicum]
MEKLIRVRLLDWLSENKMIPDILHGFLPDSQSNNRTLISFSMVLQGVASKLMGLKSKNLGMLSVVFEKELLIVPKALPTSDKLNERIGQLVEI